MFMDGYGRRRDKQRDRRSYDGQRGNGFGSGGRRSCNGQRDGGGSNYDSQRGNGFGSGGRRDNKQRDRGGSNYYGGRR